MNTENHYDIAIIGGGIAGMTAAIYAARANRSCIVLESNITGGLANSTYTVENFPSYVEVHGMDLMQKIRDQIETLGVVVEEVCEITSFDFNQKVKKITTESEEYTAGAVIIATGRAPLALEVPTECDQIHYCAICDGAPYKNKNVLVVGGGNSAFDEGLYLLQLGVKHLTLIEKMDRFFAAEATQNTLKSNAHTTCHTDTIVEDVVVENGLLVAALLKNEKTGESSRVPVDGIFVFLGQRPNTEMFEGIIDMNKQGYITADASMQTNIPGVFAAGDVNEKMFRQLTTAAADGTIAALMADRYLRS